MTGSTHFVGDIGIDAGRVAQVGGRMRADRDIDARGRLVLPGGVDPHVHLVSSEPPGSSVPHTDDIEVGTRAAAVGGITTVGNIAFGLDGETPMSIVERTTAAAFGRATVDFVMHPVVLDPRPDVVAEMPLLATAGHPSIKIFTVAETFDARIDDYVALVSAAGRAGIVTMVHCEDGPINRHRIRELLRSGRGDVTQYSAARPAFGEVAAVTRMAAVSEATDATVYITHVASGGAVTAVAASRARGGRVLLETRPIYLFFTSDRFNDADAGLYVGNPPLRAPEDVAMLWSHLASGQIDTVASDHAPWTRAEKLESGRDVSNVRPGMPELQTMLPLLFSQGVLTGRISLERFIEVTSTNAAKAFGLYPRKGSISVGGDADLVLWDPNLTRTIRADEGESGAGFSLYEGWTVTGWPAMTLVRGRVVADEGRPAEGGCHGRLAPRHARVSRAPWDYD